MRIDWLTAYEPGVQQEIFRIGHHNVAGLMSGGVLLMSLVGVTAYQSLELGQMLPWIGVALFSRACVVVLWLRFKRAAQSSEPADAALMRRWAFSHTAMMAVLGVATGMYGSLYLPMDSPAHAVHNLFLTVAFVGALANAVANNASHDLPGLVLGMLLGVPLMCGHMVVGFGNLWMQAVLMTLLFMALMLWIGIKSHERLIHTIRLRFANEVLARETALAASRAEQANRDKSAFLAAASHDLRQPVHALMLLVEALRAQDRQPRSGPVDRGELVNDIGQAADAIASLFNSLMELSRMESGGETIYAQDLDLESLVRQWARRHAVVAEGRQLRLRTWIAPSLRNLRVTADAVLLERIVSNLLSNALRYTRSGGVLVSLRKAASGAVRLEVWDSGIGIRAEHLEHIFDPYFQVGNPQRDRDKGIGLGLAIVRRAAELLQCPLEVASRPGHGSRFRIALRNWRLAQPAAAQAFETLPAAAELQVLAQRRLLLVDDDVMVRQAMRTLLGSWGMDLRLAANAREAMAQLGEPWTPELILCDYRLADSIDGVQLLNEMLERFPAAVGILQTGELAENVRTRAEDAGFAVVYKPVRPALLASTLRALLPARAPAC